MIVFTSEEREYIIKDFGNWHISDDCPANLKESIQKKLDLLYSSKEKKV